MRHRCRFPRTHHLLRWGVLLVWLVLGVGLLLPLGAYALTHSAWFAFLSVGLGLVPGTLLVMALVTWRCRPRCTVGHGPSLVMPLAVLTWVLREC